MKNYFTLFLFHVFLMHQVIGQNWVWSEFQDNSAYQAYSREVCAGEDYVYTTGTFEDTVRFENGTELISTGHKDLFVVKRDKLGNFIWVKSFGTTTGDDIGNSIDVDTLGNIYIAATIHQSPTSPLYHSDSWLLKLDNAGDTIYTRHYTGTHTGDAVKVLPSQDIIFIGSFYNTVIVDGNYIYGPSGGNYGQSLFITRLTPNASFVWGKMAGGNDYTYIKAANKIAIDNTGHFYFTGKINYHNAIPVYFDTIQTIYPGDFIGDEDAYLVKYDILNGDAVWFKRLVGVGAAEGYDVTTSPNGNITIVGRFGSELHFNNLSYNQGRFFMHQYNSAGGLVWHHELVDKEARSIVSDDQNNVYTAVMNATGVDSISITGVTNHLNSTLPDFVVAKLNASGQCVWMQESGPNNIVVVGTRLTFSENQLYIIGGSYQPFTIGPFNSFHSDFNYLGNDFTARLSLCTASFPYILAQKNTLCHNDSTYAYDFINNQGQHIWNTGDMGDTISILDSGSYFTTYIDLAGCAATSNTIQIGMHSLVYPTLQMISPNNVCFGDSIGFTTNNAYTDYYWNNGSTEDTIYVQNSDSIYASVTDMNLCTSNSDTLIATILPLLERVDIQNSCNPFIWVNGQTFTQSDSTASYIVSNTTGCDSLITINLTIYPTDLNVTVLDQLTLKADAIGVQYQWLDCDNNYEIITNETNQVFTVSANGNYAVKITENGCTDTSACVNVSTVSINKNKFEKILISPNPTVEFVSINTFGADLISLKVYSSKGQLVLQESQKQLSSFGSESYQFRLNSPAGIYFVEIVTNSGQTIHKLIKE